MSAEQASMTRMHEYSPVVEPVDLGGRMLDINILKETNSPKLLRGLTLFPTTAIVIGSVIGSGIFVSTPAMARALDNAPLLMLAWVVAGLMTLFGALTECELVGQSPVTGGLYEYLREAYGPTIGFFYGWANFMIAGSGAIAAIAFIFASYLGEFVELPHLVSTWESWPLHIPLAGTLYPLQDLSTKLVGAVLIVFLTGLNIRGVKFGAWVQAASTSAKVIAIAAVILLVFIFGKGSSENWLSRAGSSLVLHTSTWYAFALALSSAFWAYDGWGNVTYIAGEVKTPERTIPRAILLGTLIFTTLYLLMNAAYLYVLPVDILAHATQDRVASQVMSQVMGTTGARLIALLILLSTFDTTNGGILTNARVYLAMAEKKVFPGFMGRIHAKYQTPHVALILQGIWSIILLMTGSFGIIIGMYVFVNWLLYVLMGLAVFEMRRREPRRERPFQIPGYPWVPLVYVTFSAAFVTLTLVGDIGEFVSGKQPFMQSVMGLILVASGYPILLWSRRLHRVMQ